MLGSGRGGIGDVEFGRDRAPYSFRALIIGSPTRRDVIAAEFRSIGFDVRVADADAEAIWKASEMPAELVAVDFSAMVPHRLQWCRSFRSNVETSTVPLVAIINPDQDGLRLELLAADIDDCLIGPKLSEESVLRIRALLRRASLPARPAGELRYADIVLDPSQLKVWRGGMRVPLSMLQFQVLQLMMISPGKVFSRAELRRLVWQNRHVEDVAIIKCISRLGQSLNANGASDIIRRTRSGGYSLDVEASQISSAS